MGLEIERRFIVINNQWEDMIENSMQIKQGYLSNSIHGWTVRVRTTNQNSLLTLKATAGKISRHEFEYAIPLEDAEELLNLTNWQITKIRHTLHVHNTEWVIDCFTDKNQPLIIAEVELSSIEEQCLIPNWCGKEISTEKALSNAYLAEHPISQWSPEFKSKFGIR